MVLDMDLGRLEDLLFLVLETPAGGMFGFALVCIGVGLGLWVATHR